MLRRLLSLFLAFVFAFVLLIQTSAEAATSQYLFPGSADNPAATDWSQVTFNSFPAIEGNSTAILDDQNLINQLGYNPSRSWNSGAKLTNILKVGDLYNFGLGDKSVGAFLGNADPSKVSLGSFSALNGQSLNGLLKAVPGLGDLPVSSLPLAQSLFSGQWSAAPMQGVQLAAQYYPEINQFLQNNPTLAEIPIGQIVQGDWQGALSKGAQIGIQKLVEVAPQLANVPLNNIVGAAMTGDWKGALDSGLQFGANKLIKEFPALQNVPVGDILGAITSGNPRALIGVGLQYGGQLLVKDLAKDFPQLSNIPLGIVLNLNNFSLSSVPGLANTAIKAFPKIANQAIGSIPGLGSVSVSQVLSFAQLLNMGFAKVDFLDQAATKADFTLSGSTKDDSFKAEPCTGKCPKFEVQDSKTIPGTTVKGRQWVSGDQKVPGGKGILGKMNGGKEPTGLLPWGFGPNMKLVATKVIDTKGSIELGLYIRVCAKYLLADFGCTPFFIGPIPFGSVSEKGLVLIATSAPPPSIPGGGFGGDIPCNIVSASSTSEQKSKYGYKAYPVAKASDLTSVATNMGRTEVLNKDAAAAFNKMKQDAAKQGIDLSVVSGYRSVDVQQQLWDAQVAKQGSEQAAAQISAPPGYSEHQTGYALDIGQTSAGGSDLNQSFQNTPAYQWLQQNAGKYGFQQSYTGASGGTENEPWHWKYEGTQTAQAVFNSSSSASQQDPVAVGNQNLTQYLGRLSAGESANNTILGPNPKTGAYGEYQFTPETRATILQRTGLDGWSTDKATRDKAALYWIQVIGQEKGVDLIGAIKQGDFATADSVLSKGQFTSLPGGKEVAQIWQNASYQQKYGPVGKGSSGSCVTASAPVGAVPCPDGKKCVFYNPLPGSALTTPFGYIPSRGRKHWGVDLATTYNNTGPGSKIHAAWDGVVSGVPDYFAGDGNYGHRTEIYHQDRGLYTSYSHQYSRNVAKGQNIKRGQIIGVEGNTSGGMFTHLHYEIASNASVPSQGSNPFDPTSIPHEPSLGR
jgi:LAS superfamily LD-carboxypeptidase LdcB